MESEESEKWKVQSGKWVFYAAGTTPCISSRISHNCRSRSILITHHSSLITQHSSLITQHSTPAPDTIAAIATAVGNCGIGVIRVSGSGAFAVADQVFHSRAGTSAADHPSHTIHYGSLVHPESGAAIDNALLSIFRAPTSYTGEDVVELSCHGGYITLRKALEAVFTAGARPAEPGEFTKRAFLNGRLDLSQAEAVNDIIRARTDEAHRLALRQLGGDLSREVSGISDRILSILSRVEAAVDFPDDVDEPARGLIASEVGAMVEELDRLAASGDRGRVYREGISLAIVGRPNVGKSSLLNALLRQSRAIVTAIPGTTRDVIEETINIRGIPVVAADTAGLRAAGDEVERIGIEMTERAMAASGVVLVVLDATTGVAGEDMDIIERAGPTKMIVLNKVDAMSDAARDEMLSRINRQFPTVPSVPVSAALGSGIEELEDAIAALVLGSGAASGEGIFVTNVRHKLALLAARDNLRNVLVTIQDGLPIDLLSVDLIAARTSLGEITGDTASDDLIDRIFGDFCIGK